MSMGERPKDETWGKYHRDAAVQSEQSRRDAQASREELLTMQIESDAIEMSKLSDQIWGLKQAATNLETKYNEQVAWAEGQAEAYKQVMRHLLTYIIRG